MIQLVELNQLVCFLSEETILVSWGHNRGPAVAMELFIHLMK